jgi:2-keto-4-pentenoate hydratase/2-oxohepta-3-ene-1,7-dioic acid hydratase in catechol pathway
MKLATFTHGKTTRIGVVVDDQICDLGSLPGMPSDMMELLNAGAGAMKEVRRKAPDAKRIALEEVHLEAPVLRPRKFLGLGGSYESHLKETRHLMQRPAHQTWFNKQVTCVNGPYDPIEMPRVSSTLDYEGELALIIGRRGRHVRAAEAMDVIAGLTICNDVSVREWQLRAMTATLGKSFDTHGPLGPWMVTTDEIRDPHGLSLQTWVNGELRQSACTSELIFTVGQMIEELSAVFTLEPGDILSTGSPAGVGGAQKPPVYLKVGDVVRVAVSGIGHIENRVVPEAA